LKSDDLVYYNNITKEITNDFLSVSLTIRAIEEHFRQFHFGQTMATLIRQLQLLEKEKLQIVRYIIQLHILSLSLPLSLSFFVCFQVEW
jgi:hypothetical protein